MQRRQALLRDLENGKVELDRLKNDGRLLRKEYDQKMLDFHLKIKFGAGIDKNREEMVAALTKKKNKLEKQNKKREKTHSKLHMSQNILKIEPQFFPEILNSDRSEFADMWRIAAMRRKSLLYSNKKLFSIGILQAQDASRRLAKDHSGSQTSIALKIVSFKDDIIKIGYKLKFDSSLDLEGERSGIVNLAPRGSQMLSFRFRLVRSPYKFPLVQFDTEELENEEGSFKILLPIMPHWFFSLFHIPKFQFLKKYESAAGVYLQSEGYELDQFLIKGANELAYLLPELEKVNPAVKIFL